MKSKIRRHRDRRGAEWTNLEEPGDLAARLPRLAAEALLIDCATLWLTNRMGAGHDPRAETARLVDALTRAPCPTVVVTNEIGWGIVPMDADTRAFRQAHGEMNQALAAMADGVVLVASGLPLWLKGAP